jgi:hypothetical protein
MRGDLRAQVQEIKALVQAANPRTCLGMSQKCSLGSRGSRMSATSGTSPLRPRLPCRSKTHRGEAVGYHAYLRVNGTTLHKKNPVISLFP